jgi:aryl-alcohol dehydrogenase-like predicted oxidoreductase
MIMNKRKLATLEVPVIGMGSASTFDVEDPEGYSVRRQIMDNCLAAGSNFIDTSPMYGRAEKALGVAMEGKTEDFILATKVWCCGKDTGKGQIDRSFKLLGADHIHVLQIHNMIDWKTHLPYLEYLREARLIDLIGVTFTLPPGFPLMMEIMKTKRIQTIQISYNVLEREAEKQMLPLAEELGIGVIVMRPLASGRLAKNVARPPNVSPLREFGIETWPQALLAWVLADPRVSVLIPSTTRPERILENAKAGSLPPLPQDLRDYISKEAQRVYET